MYFHGLGAVITLSRYSRVKIMVKNHSAETKTSWCASLRVDTLSSTTTVTLSMISQRRIASDVLPDLVLVPKKVKCILVLRFTSGVKVKKKDRPQGQSFFHVLTSRPYSGLIASTGQTSAQAAQSVHSSGSIK